MEDLLGQSCNFILRLSYSFLNLEDVAHLSTIVASIAAIFAIVKFFRDKKRERDLSVINQLEFFRTEILNKSDSAYRLILSKNKNHNFKSQKFEYIENFSWAWIYLKDREKVDLQINLEKDEEIKSHLTSLFNDLEQFSWSVILNKTIDHESLFVVRDTFITTVEQFSHRLLFLRAENPRQFEGVKNLYYRWAVDMIRETEKEKLDRVIREAKKLKEKQS